MQYEKSIKLLERAKKVTPLGAQTYSKSYRYFCEGNSPAFIERGQGCYVWDVDGNKFIDFICALGPITIGYNDERINSAIIEQLNKGIIFSQSSISEVELAEKLITIIPGAEMIRFVKNGSDATSSAVRLARAYTGRDMIACCGYHGMQDWYIGSTVNNKGVPKEVCELTKSFDYNNLESLKKLFAEFPNKFAAVIIEPIQSDGPDNGFLKELKALTNCNGALLIFDEVVSGFRYALGGAAELYNVAPDMAAFGKGMANGMPISAISGKKEVMELIGSKGVFVSTTFGGECLSICAALATIKILEHTGTYQGIWLLGNMMVDGLKKLTKQYELENIITVSGLAPHAGVIFEGIGNLDYLDINSVFQQKMIENGILSVGINNISASHTEKEIELFLYSAEEAMKDVKRAVEADSVAHILKGGKINPIFKRNTK